MKIKMHTYKQALASSRKTNASQHNASDAYLLDYLPSNLFGRTHPVQEMRGDCFVVKVCGSEWVVDPMFVKEVVRI